MRSIAITNQKGGVGKTTTSVSLGSALAQMGKRVCLVDLDPQANLTMHLGVEPGQAKASVYELLGGSATLDESVRTVRENLDLVPAEIDLAGAEVELVGVVGREKLLRDALFPAQDRYDVLLIDCPPSLGLLTINALSAVEEVFIALQPHFLAMQGLGKLLETVSLVQRRINERLKIAGVILCMYDSRTALCSEVAAEVGRFFQSEHPLKSLWEGARIFRRYVRRNITLAEAPGHGQNIFEYAPGSHGAEDYRALAEELVAWWAGTLIEGEFEEPGPSAEDGDEQAEEGLSSAEGNEGEVGALGAEMARTTESTKPSRLATEAGKGEYQVAPTDSMPPVVEPAEASVGSVPSGVEQPSYGPVMPEAERETSELQRVNDKAAQVLAPAEGEAGGESVGHFADSEIANNEQNTQG